MRQRGVTLVELMISMTLGMCIVLAITGLVVSSKTAQSTQHEAIQLQDTARFAFDNISRSVKQAGHMNLDQSDAPWINTQHLSPSLVGFDASSVAATSYGLDGLVNSKNTSDASDILVLRFFGSGTPADNTVLNCAGFGEAAPSSQSTAEQERGWSVYYVSNDVDDEPALFCKYLGDKSFSSQAIARGVESFQVLYGINHAHTTQFLSAQEITKLDADIPASELNQRSHWKKISALKIAMLIRSAENVVIDDLSGVYNLFGDQYGNNMGTHDIGTQIHSTDISPKYKNRLRRIVSTTIQLRNPVD